jgi:hypothetical protein
MLKKKIWDNFRRIIEVFTQKILLGSQKYGIGIRDPEQTYSGSRIGIRNTGTGIYMRSTRSYLLDNVGMLKKVSFKDFSFYPILVVTMPKNNLKPLSLYNKPFSSYVALRICFLTHLLYTLCMSANSSPSHDPVPKESIFGGSA